MPGDSALQQYNRLAKALEDQWGLGRKEVEKFDLLPYLIPHQRWTNELAAYEETLRPGGNAGDRSARRQAALEAGNAYFRLAPEFDARVVELSSALATDVKSVTTNATQRQAVLNLMTWLRQMHQQHEKQAGFDGMAEGVIRMIEARYDRAPARV